MNRWLAGCVLFIAAPLAAQRTLYAPLAPQLPLGARAIALGGANMSSRDAESALGNPALAGTASAAAFTLGRYHENAHGGSIGVTTPVGSMGVGVAVSYLDYTPSPISFPLYSDNALVRGTTTAGHASSMAAAFSLSTTFKGWRWGAAATYLEERVFTERASVAALNLGAAKDNFWRNMTLGVAVQNIGPSLRFSDGSFGAGGDPDVDLPLRLAAGLSSYFRGLGPWFDLSLSGGAAVRRDGLVSGNVGGELSWVPIEGISFALRAGVRRAELTVQRPMTAGLGVTVDRFALDYAWEQMSEGNGVHRLGLRLR